MTPLLLMALLQAPAPPVPERFSILVPVRDQPCIPRPAPDEIVVCADALPDQTLPLPGEAVSPNPVPSNRDRSGIGALAAATTPCVARMAGCQGGLGLPLLPVINSAVALVKRATAGKVDKSRRVPIPLD